MVAAAIANPRLLLHNLCIASAFVGPAKQSPGAVSQGVRPAERAKVSSPAVFPATQQHAAPAGSTTVSTASVGEASSLLLEVDDLLRPHVGTSLYPDDIRREIHDGYQSDLFYAVESGLPFESFRSSAPNQVEYEHIISNDGETIALRTAASTPLLNQDEIDKLRFAAEWYWTTAGGTASRFTYQRRGNSEAHLSDVVRSSRESTRDVTSVVESLLLDRVFPWVREAFLSREDGSRGLPGDDAELYVYDSLFIRYNATAAAVEADDTARSVAGAGQPLHRDLGYVSVNVMLNSQDEFEGGGTFFEDQLSGRVDPSGGLVGNEPLKPSGSGHALAHHSCSRHAGAATTGGVRDILVLFVAVKGVTGPAGWEVGSRLKANARRHRPRCGDARTRALARVLHHRMAIDESRVDGEAWQHLGMAILDCHEAEPQGTRPLELAAACLGRATELTPNDGKLWNNVAVAFERLLHALQDRSPDRLESERLDERIIAAYRRALSVHSACREAGCDVEGDYESACLNYGLYLSRKDDFAGAVEVLSKIERAVDSLKEGGPDLTIRQRVMADAMSLLMFCRKRLQARPCV